MRKTPLLCALLLVMLGVASADEPKADFGTLARKATEAYKAKDFAGFRDAMIQADGLVPGYPRVMYNVACGYALTGKPDEAVAWLDRIAAMGLVFAPAEDEDLASIKETAAFKAVVARFEANRAPVHNAEVAFAVTERGFISEGVAYDPVDKSFYVSSVHKRKVVRVDKAGKVSDFVANRDELWAAYGMRVDPKRRVLWVATGAIPQMVGFKAEDAGRSGILKYDLATGKLVKAYVLPASSDKHTLGDVTLDSKGTLYTTDSETAAIYVIRQDKDALEQLQVTAPFASLQGLALSADETRLYVADYGRGIFVVDLKTLAAKPLARADSVCLLGIDGLYFAKGNLYAMQNGIRPNRVARIALDRDGTRAERLETIEASSPALGEPTLGVVVDDWLYFIADSQWAKIDAKGTLAPESELRDHTIMRAKL